MEPGIGLLLIISAAQFIFSVIVLLAIEMKPRIKLKREKISIV
jgi:hypothetical protein